MRCKEWINDIIYKHKLVVFGLQDDNYTRRSIDLFKDKFKQEAKLVFLDDDVHSSCFEKETIPQIYLNGMKLGGYYRVENLCYSDNLSLFF